MPTRPWRKRFAPGGSMAVEAVPVIVVDTREQLPLPIEGYDVERCILSIGDYGVKGFSDWANPAFIIERKSLSDLVHSLGKDRDRFEREVLKMKQFGFRALLIEALESEVQQGRYSSLMTVAAVLQSLATVRARTGQVPRLAATPACELSEKGSNDMTATIHGNAFTPDMQREIEYLAKTFERLDRWSQQPHAEPDAELVERTFQEGLVFKASEDFINEVFKRPRADVYAPCAVARRHSDDQRLPWRRTDRACASGRGGSAPALGRPGAARTAHGRTARRQDAPGCPQDAPGATIGPSVG